MTVQEARVQRWCPSSLAVARAALAGRLPDRYDAFDLFQRHALPLLRPGTMPAKAVTPRAVRRSQARTAGSTDPTIGRSDGRRRSNSRFGRQATRIGV